MLIVYLHELITNILETHIIHITGALNNQALIVETVGTNLNNNVISTKLEDLKYFF